MTCSYIILYLKLIIQDKLLGMTAFTKALLFSPSGGLGSLVALLLFFETLLKFKG